MKLRNLFEDVPVRTWQRGVKPQEADRDELDRNAASHSSFSFEDACKAMNVKRIEDDFPHSLKVYQEHGNTIWVDDLGGVKNYFKVPGTWSAEEVAYGFCRDMLQYTNFDDETKNQARQIMNFISKN